MQQLRGKGLEEGGLLPPPLYNSLLICITPFGRKNPHVRKVTNFQHSFKINVSNIRIWASWCSHSLWQLNWKYVSTFLSTRQFGLSDNIPLAKIRILWFMYDGVPFYFSRHYRRWINKSFPERWINRVNSASINWAPRSPEFHPMDFKVLDQIKHNVYSQPVWTICTKEL